MFAFEKLHQINKIRAEHVCVARIVSDPGFVLAGISDSEAPLTGRADQALPANVLRSPVPYGDLHRWGR